MMAASQAQWLLAIPFAVIGLPVMVTGAVMLHRAVRTAMRGHVVDATVVQRDDHPIPAAERRAPGGIGGSTTTPYFRYRTNGGTFRVAKLDHQTQQRRRSEGYRLRYPLGANVRIRIDPALPDVAHEPGMASLIVLPLLAFFAGTLTTLIALGIYFGS